MARGMAEDRIVPSDGCGLEPEDQEMKKSKQVSTRPVMDIRSVYKSVFGGELNLGRPTCYEKLKKVRSEFRRLRTRRLFRIQFRPKSEYERISSKLAPNEHYRIERTFRLLDLFGPPPKEISARRKRHYHNAIKKLARSVYSDEKLLELSTLAGRELHRVHPATREPLRTLRSLKKAALQPQEIHEQDMPEIEATTKRARRALEERRNELNKDRKKEKNAKGEYYDRLAKPYWAKNPNRSKTAIAKRLLEKHEEEIRKHLKLEKSESLPSYHTIRQTLTKPSK